MFNSLFVFFNGLWINFCDFMLDIVDFFLSLPAWFLEKIFDLWMWYRDTMLNLVLKAFVYALSQLSDDSAAFELNYEYIHNILDKIDYVFPVNHFAFVVLSLLNLYVGTKLLQLATVLGIRYLLLRRV